VKQPVTVVPITVPTVGVTTQQTDGIDGVYVGNLNTVRGPQAFQGRHALLLLSLSQAECLVHDLAAKLGMTVS
jgi:hypothetical protein